MNIPPPAILFTVFFGSEFHAWSLAREKTLNKNQGRGIYISSSMANFSTDSVHEVLFPGAPGIALEAGPSDVESQVIRLFDHFRDSLLRYVLSFGLPVHDGEEVVQETFLALFRHLQRGKSRQNLQGWIFRVAHNLALKQRQTNQKSLNSSLPDWTLAEMQIDPAPSPEEQASFTQRWRRMLAVLDALPEEDQYCLRLRTEGLRYREIAAVLDMSLGAVSISLARSLARLTRADGR
jgi:RNA polymerase sigma-70 factor, ECF subfamily